jgi:2-polyprenyl-6-methoxyphenol hydroxylase-like FAD-dependent oxidoreductase
MTDFEILVVGGGVAGCATAIELLSAGWRVGILHKGDDVSAIESLSPGAVCDLRRLAIRTESNLSEVVAWWGSDRQTRAVTPGAAIVHRCLLTNNLRLHAIEGGAIVIENAKLLSIERFRTGWKLVHALPDGGHRRFSARCLIDATGRSSAIGRRLGAQRVTHDQLFCISVSLHDPGLVGTWTESTSHGWWNLCCLRKEGTLSFYSTAQKIREAKQDITGCLYETGHLRHLLSARTFGNSIVRPCGSSRLVPCAGPGWVSVGDAASTLQPLASAGVSKALRDARMVQQTLAHEPMDYDRSQLAEFRSYVRQLAQHYALEKRWSESPFWATRVAAPFTGCHVCGQNSKRC